MSTTIIALVYRVQCDGCGFDVELTVPNKELRQALFAMGWSRRSHAPHAPAEHFCHECTVKRNTRRMRTSRRATVIS